MYEILVNLKGKISRFYWYFNLANMGTGIWPKIGDGGPGFWDIPNRGWGFPQAERRSEMLGVHLEMGQNARDLPRGNRDLPMYGLLNGSGHSGNFSLFFTFSLVINRVFDPHFPQIKPIGFLRRRVQRPPGASIDFVLVFLPLNSPFPFPECVLLTSAGGGVPAALSPPFP